jgi:tetratricopeptide (TPR) repeat protein
MHNHFIEGRQWYDEALSISKGAPPLIRIRLLNGAASMAMARSDIERTAAFSEQCLALSQEQKNEWGLALSLHHLGIAVRWQGDYKRAQNLLEEGLVLSRKIGNWAIINYLLGDLGTLAGTQGDFEQARAYFEEFLALARKHADKWLNSFALQFLAILAYRQGNYSRARTYSEQALTLDNKSGDKRLLCSLLEIIGRVAFHQGKSERAARLISAVEALNESIGILYDADIPEEPNIVVTIREQLGDAMFEELSAEGRAMTMEQAIAYALENQE